MEVGKIRGWKFNRGYNAEGDSSTMQTLNTEKQRLEKRIVAIPKLIAQLEHSIKITQNDVTWLGSLSNRNRKKWEKENGTTIEAAQFLRTKRITQMKGQVVSLKTEKARIPEQIKSIQRQIGVLVKGESVGLEQGLDKETAQQLGEIQLQKEREKMEHERTLREAEIQAQQEEKAAEKTDTGANTKRNWIIGVSVVALIILIVIAYKKFKAKAATSISTPSAV